MGDREELMELRRLSELEAKFAAKPARAPEKEYSPTEDMNAFQKFGAGVGSGATRVFRRVGNLLAAEGEPGEFEQPVAAKSAVSREAIQSQQERDAPLGDTGSGALGQFTGEMVATAPAGVVGKGFQAARGAVQGGGRLLRALTSPTAAMGAEGALQGLITSAPDSATAGAAVGAGVGAGFGAGGKLLSRALQGIVRKSPEAEMMEMIAKEQGEDMRLPLSQAASEEGISGVLKSIYGEILPFVPGATATLKKQKRAAEQAFRNVVLKEASPQGTKLMTGSVHDNMKLVNDAFEKAYMDLGKDSSMRTNLLRAKTQLGKMAAETGDDTYLQPLESIDELLKQNFVKESPEELAKYEALNEPWQNFLRVRKAAARTKGQHGEFKPTELRAATKRMEGDKALGQGEARMQDIAELGEETVGVPTKYPGMFSRALAWGGLGAMGGTGSPLGALAAWTGARGMASRGMQEALMGDLETQRALIKLLREHPETATMLRSGLQGATTAEINDAPR